jgi:hypothetical protein
MCRYVLVFMYVNAGRQTSENIHMRISHTHVHAYGQIHVYTHTSTHTHIHTYIHTYNTKQNRYSEDEVDQTLHIHIYIHSYIHTYIHLHNTDTAKMKSTRLFSAQENSNNSSNKYCNRSNLHPKRTQHRNHSMQTRTNVPHRKIHKSHSRSTTACIRH